MSDPAHILLVRLSSVGDVLLATPVARALRQRYPQARLSWLVDAGYEPLLTGNPHLDRVVTFDHSGRHRGPAGIGRLAAELGRVALLVDLQHKLRTAVLAARLRPAERLTLVKRRGWGLVRAMLGRDAVLGAPHQIWRYLALLDVAPASAGQEPPRPELVCDPDAGGRVRDRLAGSVRRPRVGLVPAARHATKAWPLVHWRALAERCQRAGWSVVLLGGDGEAALAAAIGRDLAPGGWTALAGGDLAALAAALAACDLVISPDSGPAHMAAALGVATLVLFGPTSPARWAPIGPRVEVLRQQLACSPCSNHGGQSCPLGTLDCMRQLRPERVWQAAGSMLGAPVRAAARE